MLVNGKGGFHFYCNTQYIMLDVEIQFVQIKRDFLINQFSLMYMGKICFILKAVGCIKEETQL